MRHFCTMTSPGCDSNKCENVNKYIASQGFRGNFSSDCVGYPFPLMKTLEVLYTYSTPGMGVCLLPGNKGDWWSCA